MLEEKISQDKLKEVIRLTRAAKNIAFVQGTGKDILESSSTRQERYFRLGFVEVKCITGMNIYGLANCTVTSRGVEVLDTSWDKFKTMRRITIDTYKPKKEWVDLISEWGKKKKPEKYLIKLR